MQFLNPAAFYLLGLIPIVVALHFLKLRRHTHLVPSIMLWLSTAEDRRANVPFQRLRNLLLPLLQVLFVLLVTFSAARPAVRQSGFMPGRAILIVDNSASMLSTETGQTRLELAQQAAREQIEQIFAEGGIMLMVTNPSVSEAYIRETFTTETAKLHSAIGKIGQSHAPRDLLPIFDAVTRYVESPQDRVFFISDNFENLPDISLPVHQIGVGGAAKNIGIVRFSVEIVAGRYEVLVGIRNFTDVLQELDVQLAVENAPFDEKTASIPPGGTKSILFSGDPSCLEDRVMRAHLHLEDDFAVDNSAFAPLSTVSTLRLLLVSDNQASLLPALLRSYGEHVALHEVAQADYHGTGDAHIAIFDGGTPAGREAFSRHPEVTAETHLIFINPSSNLPFGPEDVQVVEEVARVLKTDETHPLMADVSLQELRVLESTYRKLPPSGRSLVETERGSLIWMGEAAGNQYLVFEFDAFNPEVSNFVMTIPGAPLFIYQCLARFEVRSALLQPRAFQAEQTRHAFRTGEEIKIAPIIINNGTTLRVQKPDGQTVKAVDSIFTETDQVGVYTLLAGDTALERFTVNLLNPKESALLHSATPPVVAPPAAIEGGFQPMTQEAWQIPALLAFIVLLLEWWLYHRDGTFIRASTLSEGTAEV